MKGIFGTLLASVLVGSLVSGCAPDPPPNLPHQWVYLHGIDGLQDDSDSWLSLEADGTGEFHRIRIRPGLDCDATEYDYLSGTVTWEMASNGQIDVTFQDQTVPVLADTALFASLDWDKVSIATCTDSNGDLDAWIFYS